MEYKGSRIDILVNIETLGKSSNSTIFQISAASFCLFNGVIIDTFDMRADISKLPINSEGPTLKWWLNTNPELLKRLLNSGNLSEFELVKEFYDWLQKDIEVYENVYLWGNGILFDNRLLKSHMEAAGLTYPIFYRNDRDMRTILELAAFKLDLSEEIVRNRFGIPNTHDSLDDVKNQINIVCECYSILVGH